MHRRQFNKLIGAAVAGMTIGSQALAQEKAAEATPVQHKWSETQWAFVLDASSFNLPRYARSRASVLPMFIETP